MIDGSYPTLYEASSGDDKDMMRTMLYVSAAIVSYLDFKNRRNTMNDQQIAETAILIVEEFPYLKLTDLKLFIRRLKCNAYGEVYDLDGQSFIGWLRKYVEEKRMAMSQIMQKREQDAKEKADNEIEAFYQTEEGKQVQQESIKLFADIQKEFADNTKPHKPKVEQHKNKDPKQLRIEEVRRQVIAEYNEQVLRNTPEKYMEVMNGLINEALKKEGLI